MNEKDNYLGIDWGSAKVGVALAHAETRLALAYTTLKNDVHLLKNIGELLEKEAIGTVVIGTSARTAAQSMADRRQQSDTSQEEHEGEKLGKLLAERFGVVAVYQDEMFTSKMAQANLIAQGEKHVSAHDDAEAASILLQSFLDKSSPM